MKAAGEFAAAALRMCARALLRMASNPIWTQTQTPVYHGATQ